MQRSAGPTASSSASTAGHSERRVGLDRGVELELAAREHDRHAVLADAAGQQDAVAGRERWRATGARARSRRPMPVVQTYIPSAWPRSTTFVSPVTISTPGRPCGARDRVDLRAQLIGAQSLLEHQREAQRERARTRRQQGR